MPDALALSIDSASLRRALARLQKLGGDVEKPMFQAVDRACEIVVNHMKGQHFFVGTAKGSTKRAQENEFTFVNPDGSPRFKTRTANLINSMQSRGAQRSGKDIRGRVFVGVEYAKDIDEGGPGRRAFPFRRPAIEHARPIVRRDTLKIVEAAIRRANGRG